MVCYLLAFLAAQKEQGEQLVPALSAFLKEDKDYCKETGRATSDSRIETVLPQEIKNPLV